MMKEFLVLAGNREEFEGFLDSEGLTDSQAVYGYSADRISEVVAEDVVVIGTFWDRKGAKELYSLANTRIRLKY